ncbi:hypothetical protein H6F98_24930 [Microcoleus sp. FACHB-SPT15]|uniref:hypothetical protein n=1 Tax=Microcoleus sp. FACHB-SPT15 TaxID=2692830 RepID=UPI00177C7650|nr:hypothetical protein [Microcoleus sp. FACHB-SPT15]MBD1808673.1 hypothetical protein [Microcoleus sp. FACHB-SPT15]
MAQRKIHHPMDDIARQARQGSVAAIIQTLNEQLADVGVRTRAVFADGVLQLLCEAASKEQLEPSVLIAQIRQILEGIAPRNIRRVRINSRIVREQQLLWLEEIMRDPEDQLLWSEEIILAKPNLFKRIAQGIKDQQTVPRKTPSFTNASSHNHRHNKRYQRGILNGVGLTLLLIIGGWFLYDWLGSKVAVKITTQSPNSTGESSLTPTSSTTDPFVEAVRLAEQASVAGQTVKTSAQWLDLAAKWERASDLMGAVKPNDQRYKTAQDRMKLYRKNSEAAQKQAIQRRS